MIDKFIYGFIDRVYGADDYTQQEINAKLIQKMDEVIENCNDAYEFVDWLKEEGAPDEVKTIIDSMLEDGTLENLINIEKLNQLESNLNNSINELTTSTQTKLDEMTTDVNALINENKEIINQNKTELNLELDKKAKQVDLETIIKRIDNLIVHSGDGSVNSAEIIDGRIGIEGTSFDLIGSNIRAIAKNVNSLISNVFNFKNDMIINLLNKDNMTDGKIIDANGNETDYDAGSYTNDYLHLRKDEKIILNFATSFTIVEYDTNKTFKSNIVVNDEDLPYIFTADSELYLRFNVYKTSKDSAMVVKGDVLPNKYIAYGEKIPFPSELTFKEFQKVYNIINENYVTNLINKDNMTNGKIIDANGNETDYDAGSYTNDYLLLRKGESIILNFATYLTIPCYDLNKKFKTNKVVGDEELPYIFTADSDMYLRFNVYNDKKDKAMVVKGKNLPSRYIPYGGYEMTNAITQDRFKNVLSGNYLFVGDSICRGEGASEPGGYAKLIAKLNPNMTYKNIAVSGATLCRRTENNPGTSILNKLEEEIELNNSYNHIVLEGAVNDLWNQSTWPLGTYDEYDITSTLNELTICGAFESLIRKCKAKWNDSFIYYIIPHTIDRINTKLGFDTLKNICKKYNVIVIDLRELSGEDVTIDYVKKTYTLTDGIGDGVHNNDLGYEKFYVKPIINILSKYQ